MSVRTTLNFHDAKSRLENALGNFKQASELDEREVKDELLDIIANVLGVGFMEE